MHKRALSTACHRAWPSPAVTPQAEVAYGVTEDLRKKSLATIVSWQFMFGLEWCGATPPKKKPKKFFCFQCTCCCLYSSSSPIVHSSPLKVASSHRPSPSHLWQPSSLSLHRAGTTPGDTCFLAMWVCECGDCLSLDSNTALSLK